MDSKYFFLPFSYTNLYHLYIIMKKFHNSNEVFFFCYCNKTSMMNWIQTSKQMNISEFFFHVIIMCVKYIYMVLLFIAFVCYLLRLQPVVVVVFVATCCCFYFINCFFKKKKKFHHVMRKGGAKVIIDFYYYYYYSIIICKHQLITQILSSIYRSIDDVFFF